MMLARTFAMLTLVLLFANPVLSQGENRMLFVSDQDGNREIYIMNPDGSGATRLTNNQIEDNEPTWSPDYRQIAFVSTRDDSGGDFSLYTMNADGSNIVRVTPPDFGNYNSSPVWSSNGTSIAFTTTRHGSSDIYTINADGTLPLRLTINDDEDVDPSWSPDGRQIVYASDPQGDFGIFVMNADGSNILSLTPGHPEEDAFPAWSPRGDEIAFASTGNNTEIYLIRPDGTDMRPLATVDEGFISAITWSPEGDQIAYSVGSGRRQSIYVIDREGNNLARLLSAEGVNASGVTWAAPDSSQYVADAPDYAPEANRECPGTEPTPFTVGQTVVIDFNVTGALRIMTRVDGGANQTIVQAYDDQSLRLLDGPVCGIWNTQPAWYWYVDYRGYRGWAAEGTNDTRWLCPADTPECVE